MAPHIVNILITSFSGLGLPATLSIPLAASTRIADFITRLSDRLPQLDSRILLTSTSSKEINLFSLAPLSSLLSTHTDDFLPLRLSVPLRGGKGGFGSQLRAAGGRMSSRRKKNQGDSNSSNRNLDGRRLRTINEAKALAEYLALKPEMDKKEKEARRKRWEQVVELAERREYDIRNGSKGRVDGKWVEDKEESGERTREAVFAAMKTGDYHDNLTGTSGSSSAGRSGHASEGAEEDEPCYQTRIVASTGTSPRCYLGFDEDDEFMSEDEDDESMVFGEGGEKNEYVLRAVGGREVLQEER